MASREDNVGSCADEESSSSLFVAFGEVLSHTDANGVISWFRPIEESREDALWKRFSFLLYVRVSFLSFGPQFVAHKDGN